MTFKNVLLGVPLNFIRMSENTYLGKDFPLEKAIFSKFLMGALVLFCGGFYWLIYQQWTAYEILLLPLITFFGTLFFSILSENRPQIQIPNLIIKFYPFGNENNIKISFLISSLVQILIIGLLGLESNNRPQLMDNYGIYYIIPLVGIFLYTWVSVAISILARVRIGLRLDMVERKINEETAPSQNPSNKISREVSIYGLNPEVGKKSAFTNIIVFVILMVTFILDTILHFYFDSGIWLRSIALPNESNLSPVINISDMLYTILIIQPILTIILVYQSSSRIKQFPKTILDAISKKYPEITQKQIEDCLINIKTL
jgi:hypothetical protein